MFRRFTTRYAEGDLVYKTDDVNWATSRITYQVKATLENAELSIAEARRLTEAAMLDKTDSGDGFTNLEKLPCQDFHASFIGMKSKHSNHAESVEGFLKLFSSDKIHHGETHGRFL